MPPQTLLHCFSSASVPTLLPLKSKMPWQVLHPLLGTFSSMWQSLACFFIAGLDISPNTPHFPRLTLGLLLCTRCSTLTYIGSNSWNQCIWIFVHFSVLAPLRVYIKSMGIKKSGTSVYIIHVMTSENGRLFFLAHLATYWHPRLLYSATCFGLMCMTSTINFSGGHLSYKHSTWGTRCSFPHMGRTSDMT